MKDNNLNVLIQSARQPVIDKLEKALEINRELLDALKRCQSGDITWAEVDALIDKAKGDSR